jgi:hypothetical protein
MSVAHQPPSTIKARASAAWQEWLVTVLVVVTATGLVMAQAHSGTDPASELSLSGLDKRADGLRQIQDPIQRDSYCVPLSAYARSLDRALPKDARIFMTGMIGETNSGNMGYYFFLRNYLFPRQIELSLDGKAALRVGGCEGVPCDSPAELQKMGFDLMISHGANGALQLTPLTEKGVPK